MDLSIIIPVYNVEKYLSECLDSTIAQQGFEYEIICINDGSTDTSANILKQYEEKYPNLIRVFSQKNRGLGATRNRGLSLAKGEYVLFLDSDDYLSSQSLKKIVYKANKFSPDIIEGRVKVLRNNVTLGFHKKDNKPIETPVSGKKFLKTHGEFTAVVWGKMYKTAFLQEHSIENFENAYYEDVVFSIPAYLKAKRVINTNIIIYNYRINKNSITGRIPTEKHIKDFINARLNIYKSYIYDIKNVKLREAIMREYKNSLYSYWRVLKYSDINFLKRIRYVFPFFKHYIIIQYYE